MHRGLTGRYDVTKSASETVSAFMPDSLPPDPPLDLSGARKRLPEQALLAGGRRDGVAALLPDPPTCLCTPMSAAKRPCPHKLKEHSPRFRTCCCLSWKKPPAFLSTT